MEPFAVEQAWSAALKYERAQHPDLLTYQVLELPLMRALTYLVRFKQGWYGPREV